MNFKITASMYSVFRWSVVRSSAVTLATADSQGTGRQIESNTPAVRRLQLSKLT